MSVELLPPAAETNLTSLDLLLIDLNEAVASAAEPLKEDFQQVAEATLQASPEDTRKRNAECLEIIAWSLFGRYGSEPPRSVLRDTQWYDISKLPSQASTEFFDRCRLALGQLDLASHFMRLVPETATGQLLAACTMPSPAQTKEQPLSPMSKAREGGEVRRREIASGLVPEDPRRGRMFGRQKALLETRTEIAPGPAAKPLDPLQQARAVINASYPKRDPSQAYGFKGFRFNPDDPLDPKLERVWGNRTARALYYDLMGSSPLTYSLERSILNNLFSNDCETIKQAIDQGVREAVQIFLNAILGDPNADDMYDLATIKGAWGHILKVQGLSILPARIGATSREQYQHQASQAIGSILAKPWRGGFTTRLVEFSDEMPASALTASDSIDTRLRLPPKEERIPRIAGYTLVKTALGNRYRFRYEGKENDPHRPCTVELPLEGREKLAGMLRDINMKRLANLLDPTHNRRTITVDDLEVLLRVNTRYLKPQENSLSHQIRADEKNMSPLDNLLPYAHLVDKKGLIALQCEGSAAFLGELVQHAFGDIVSVRVLGGKPFSPLSFMLREMEHAQLEIAFAGQAPYIKDATGEAMILLRPKALLRLAGSIIRLATTRKPKKDDVLPSLRVPKEKPKYQTAPLPKENSNIIWQQACTALSGVFGLTDSDKLIATIGARPRRDPTRVAFDAMYQATHAQSPDNLAAARVQLQEATEAIAAVRQREGHPAPVLDLLLRLLAQVERAEAPN